MADVADLASGRVPRRPRRSDHHDHRPGDGLGARAALEQGAEGRRGAVRLLPDPDGQGSPQERVHLPERGLMIDKDTALGLIQLLRIATDETNVPYETGELKASALSALDDVLERAESEVEDHYNDEDRKSTRLNSSHVEISYAVFCLK